MKSFQKSIFGVSLLIIQKYNLVNTIPQVKVLTFVDVGFQIASKIHSQRKSTIELKLSTIQLHYQGILKAYV